MARFSAHSRPQGGPYGVVFDGNNIWLSGDVYVIELRASDGMKLGQWAPPPTAGIAFDGANIWVSSTNEVVKM